MGNLDAAFFALTKSLSDAIAYLRKYNGGESSKKEPDARLLKLREALYCAVTKAIIVKMYNSSPDLDYKNRISIEAKLYVNDFVAIMDMMKLLADEKGVLSDALRNIDIAGRGMNPYVLPVKYLLILEWKSSLESLDSELQSVAENVMIETKATGIRKYAEIVYRLFSVRRYKLFDALDNVRDEIRNTLGDFILEPNEYERPFISDISAPAALYKIADGKSKWSSMASYVFGALHKQDRVEVILHNEWKRYVEYLVHSPREQTVKSGVSSSLERSGVKEPGGIDLTDRLLRIKLERVGSFASSSLALPEIADVEALDLDKEYERIQAMASVSIRPSDTRILEFAAACYYRGEFDQRLAQVSSCIKSAHLADEISGRDSSEALRLATMLPDALYGG